MWTWVWVWACLLPFPCLDSYIYIFILSFSSHLFPLQIFDKNGDVRLFLLTLRALHVDEHTHGIVLRVEPVPKSRYITARPEMNRTVVQSFLHVGMPIEGLHSSSSSMSSAAAGTTVVDHGQ